MHPKKSPDRSGNLATARFHGVLSIPQVSLGTELELALRVVLALLLGAIIGIEREYHDRPAGLRTMALVCAGSCLFTLLGTLFLGSRTDPTRIAAQVVTGIGFLGAGSILRTGDAVRGLTTAATVWAVAAIGMAVAFGLYVLAGLTVIFVVVTLIVLRSLEVRFFGREPTLRRRRRSDLDDSITSEPTD